MNNKEKTAIDNIYELIQRIAGRLQAYKIARAFDGSVTDDLRELEDNSVSILCEVGALTEQNEIRNGRA